MLLYSNKLLTAVSLLVGAATALPAPAPTPPATLLEVRADATDAWVSVDKTGLPSTVTPVVTASDGAPTTLSAIPTELTATVLTRTVYGELTTNYGTSAAQPTATNKAGAGSFLVCSNTDGDYAPFCEPTKNATMYPGTTYYGTSPPQAKPQKRAVHIRLIRATSDVGSLCDQWHQSQRDRHIYQRYDGRGR